MVIIMGGKHGKYIYVERKDGWYVKVRVLKSRDPSDPDKYIVIGPKVKEPPYTYRIMKEDDLPDLVKEKLYMV